jgi:hypothetical protein
MQVVNLRKVVLGFISSNQHPDNYGELITIETEEYGEVLVTKEESGEICFTFTKYDRLFVFDTQALSPGEEALVEKVKVTPPKVRKLNPMETRFVELIRGDRYPDKVGETIPVPYGEGEDEEICLITKTKTGIIGEFIADGVKLFYDLRNRSIRSYSEPPRMPPKREAIIAREKKKGGAGPPDMVEQLGYKGEVEMVDRRSYCNEFVCECGNVRWVKKADLFQVRCCKPCKAQEKKEVKRKG